ncbi:hypothetical protein Agub_g3257, partial [Astrephomene gubernaculifera]
SGICELPILLLLFVPFSVLRYLDVAEMSPGANGNVDDEDLDYITSDDIALFRRTLLARRFPGLQKMSDADLIALIRAERKATGRKLVPEVRLHPKTTFTPPPPKREQPAPRVTPFVPSNPFQAREQASRSNAERFTGVDTPYEAHRDDFNEGRTTDEKRRVAPFVPSCASQARDAIQIKYFLNSPQEAAPLAQGLTQQQPRPCGPTSGRAGTATQGQGS